MLTYALVVPDAARRTSLLLATGHAYFPVLTRVALAAGGVALGAWFLRDVSTLHERPVCPGAFRTLAVSQASAFIALEAAERVVSRVPLSELVGDRVFVGVAVQIAIAWALAAIVSALRRVGRRISARRPGWRRHAAPVATPVRRTLAPVSFVRRAGTARAPPLSLASRS